MVAHALLLALYLGADPATISQATPIEVHDGFDVTPEQIRMVKARAAKAFPGEVERIYAGELAHAFANMGLRVHFVDEIIGTYVIERQFTLELPPQKQESSNSEERATPAWAMAALDSDLVPHGLFASVKRVFPLKASRLHLRLPDELSYSHVMALLEALESRTYSVRKEVPSTYSSLDEKIDMSKIVRVRYRKDAETIEVVTREQRFGGMSYTFEVRPDGFLLLSVSHWVT